MLQSLYTSILSTMPTKDVLNEYNKIINEYQFLHCIRSHPPGSAGEPSLVLAEYQFVPLKPGFRYHPVSLFASLILLPSVTAFIGLRFAAGNTSSVCRHCVASPSVIFYTASPVHARSLTYVEPTGSCTGQPTEKCHRIPNDDD